MSINRFLPVILTEKPGFFSLKYTSYDGILLIVYTLLRSNNTVEMFYTVYNLVHSCFGPDMYNVNKEEYYYTSVHFDR